MNKKQRLLYKALEVIATSTITLEDAVTLKEDDLTKDEVQEVINKISEKYLDYDEKEFCNEIYNYQTHAEKVVFYISDKLGLDQEE